MTFGLPDFGATRAAFDTDGWLTHDFRLANIYNWLFMMVAKHYLLSLRDDRASAFERTLDRFYNLTFFESDRSEPTYRGAIVAVRPGLEAVLKQVGDLYPPVASADVSNTVRLQLTEVLMSLLNLKVAKHEDRLLREQMERRDQHIAGMETRIALMDVELERARAERLGLMEDSKLKDEHIRNMQAAYEAEFSSQKAYISRLEGDVKAKDEHILYLEKLLQGIQSGRVFRMTSNFSRFLGRR